MNLTPIHCHAVFVCFLILTLVWTVEAIVKKPDSRRMEQMVKNSPSEDFMPFIALCGEYCYEALALLSSMKCYNSD